jgi:hypothetical protein
MIHDQLGQYESANTSKSDIYLHFNIREALPGVEYIDGGASGFSSSIAI